MRKKLFVSYLAIILLVSVIAGMYSVKISSERYYENYQAFMKKQLETFEYAFLDFSDENTEESFKAFAKAYGERLGVLLELSEENIAEDNNIYIDKNGKKDVLTAEKRIYAGERAYMLKASVKISEIEGATGEDFTYIYFCIALGALGSVVLAYFFAIDITDPLDRLAAAAGEVAKGNYDKKILIEGTGQIAYLTDAFNRMSERIAYVVGELKNENSKLNAIVNSMVSGVMAIDVNGRIMVINPACKNILNVKTMETADLYAHPYESFIINKEIRNIMEESISKKANIESEISIENKHLRVFAGPIPKNENEKRSILGTFLVLQDITQIRKLEQVRADFVSNVTHELKTPLTSIMGFADTLKSGAINDPETAFKFINIIDIEAQRLYNLIQDTLALSEIETRKSDSNMTLEDVSAVAKEVAEMLAPQAEAKGLALKTEIGSGLPAVLCRRDRIVQLFINLIDNAIKYTETGEVKVKLSGAEGGVKITVSDTGIGIPKDSLDRVFERFYRVDKGRSRKVGGTGLGLSIVKHIVLLYKGNLEIKSEEGKGSEFTVYLPSGK